MIGRVVGWRLDALTCLVRPPRASGRPPVSRLQDIRRDNKGEERETETHDEHLTEIRHASEEASDGAAHHHPLGRSPPAEDAPDERDPKAEHAECDQRHV